MRRFYIFSTSILVLIILAGCNSGDNASTPTPAASTEATVPDFVSEGNWITIEDLTERLMRAGGEPSIAVVGDTAYYVGHLRDQVSVSMLTNMGSDSGLKRLVIDSIGGDVTLGLNFGEWVENAGLDIEVPTVCLSSCANYIFPAGNEKTIRDGAVIGWIGSAFEHELETKDEIAELLRSEFQSSFSELEASLDALPEVQKELIDIDIDRDFETLVDVVYDEILTNREREQTLYHRLDVSPDLPIFYKKCESLEIEEYTGFTLSERQMISQLRLTNLDIPEGYPGNLLTDFVQASASTSDGVFSIGLLDLVTCTVSQ